VKMRAPVLLALVLMMGVGAALAQAGDGVLSDREVEDLRDASFVPVDSITTYEKFLDRREKAIDELLAKPRHAGRELELHDLIDQIGAIADELNDHLDAYDTKHRDVRKVLPKLLLATERWSTALRSAPDNDAYKVVRKVALDAVKELHDAVTAMQPEQEEYFKAHPDAAKLEKQRMSEPHDNVTPSK